MRQSALQYFKTHLGIRGGRVVNDSGGMLADLSAVI